MITCFVPGVQYTGTLKGEPTDWREQDDDRTKSVLAVCPSFLYSIITLRFQALGLSCQFQKAFTSGNFSWHLFNLSSSMHPACCVFLVTWTSSEDYSSGEKQFALVMRTCLLHIYFINT